MNRLTNNCPQDNVSSALNLFYVKDSAAWVRGGGPGPEYKDISLDDYVRMISKEHDLGIAQSENDEDISCEMAELLFDGTDTVEGIIATLYTAGWAFAELRERLAAYEDTMPLERAQELAQAEKDGRLAILLPNDPLTLDELREMDGEYVYAVLPSGFGNRWAFVQVLSEGRNGIHLMYHDGASSAGFLLDCGAKFYRRKPEEVTA